MHSCHVMMEGFFLMSTWIPNPQSTSDTPESRTHCCSSINDLTWYSEQNQPPVKGVCMDVRATSSTTENESCSQKADLNNIYNSKAFLVETTLHMCHWNDICILLNTCHKILVTVRLSLWLSGNRFSFVDQGDVDSGDCDLDASQLELLFWWLAKPQKESLILYFWFSLLLFFWFSLAVSIWTFKYDGKGVFFLKNK